MGKPSLGDISQHRYMNIKKVIDVWVSQVGIQWITTNEGKKSKHMKGSG